MADRVFVCENPSILRAAVSLHWPCGTPRIRTSLICTEGVASAACHRLLAALARTGAPIYWRGDFDWTGLRAVTDAIERYEAHPWRMGLADYDAALAAGPTEPLRGPAADSLWDPPLAHRMAKTGRAVMEERLLQVLLADLARSELPPARAQARTIKSVRALPCLRPRLSRNMSPLAAQADQS